MNKNWSMILSIFAVVGWMLVIYLLSSQTAFISNKESKAIIGLGFKITGHFDQGSNGKPISKEINRININFRKFCHSSVYLIFSILLFLLTKKFMFKRYISIILTLTVSSVYAALDEVHQLFITGRTFEYMDMVLDCVGAVIGIVICFVFVKIMSLHTRQKNF